MRTMKRWMAAVLVGVTVLGLGGCGTVNTLSKLEDGAGGEAMRMWDRWVDGQGDIALLHLAIGLWRREGALEAQLLRRKDRARLQRTQSACDQQREDQRTLREQGGT